MTSFINITSPLDQFEIRNLLSLDAPILGNLSLSLTNIGLYLTIGGYLVFVLNLLATNNNKIVSNNWSISQKPFSTLHVLNIRLYLFLIYVINSKYFWFFVSIFFLLKPSLFSNDYGLILLCTDDLTDIDRIYWENKVVKCKELSDYWRTDLEGINESLNQLEKNKDTILNYEKEKASLEEARKTSENNARSEERMLSILQRDGPKPNISNIPSNSSTKRKAS